MEKIIQRKWKHLIALLPGPFLKNMFKTPEKQYPKGGIHLNIWRKTL
jgi:hypothetical protein